MVADFGCFDVEKAAVMQEEATALKCFQKFPGLSECLRCGMRAGLSEPVWAQFADCACRGSLDDKLPARQPRRLQHERWHRGLEQLIPVQGPHDRWARGQIPLHLLVAA